jgi:hypothetical protein
MIRIVFRDGHEAFFNLIDRTRIMDGILVCSGPENVDTVLLIADIAEVHIRGEHEGAEPLLPLAVSAS